MFRIAISAIALSGMAMLALMARADANRPEASPAAPIEAAATQATVAPASMPNWLPPLLNPAATIMTALVDLGPIPAPERILPERHSVAPVQGGNGMRTPPPTYTTHPARPAAVRIVPVRMGEGFSPEQRGQIIQALKEWNQVLNGFGRLQIVGDTAPAAGTWLLRPVAGAAPSPGSSQSLQTLAYTQPVQAGGGTVLVYTDHTGSFDLAKVMRHEFGHVLGLEHDTHGGVMAARYSEHGQQCIDRHTAAKLAAAWRLAPGDLNWCGS